MGAESYCEPDAVLAIQAAAEDFIVEIFQVRICSRVLTPSLVLGASFATRVTCESGGPDSMPSRGQRSGSTPGDTCLVL